MSSKDTDKQRVTHSKAIKIEIMNFDREGELSNNFLNQYFIAIKHTYKNRRKAVILSLILLIYFITNVTQ